MLDIQLTNEHDLNIVDGDLVLTPTIEENTKQQVKIRLQNLKGGWFLDVNDGIPYYQEILGKTYTQDLADNYIKVAIVSTPNVRSIVEYNGVLNGTTYTVTFSAKLVEGDDINNVTLEV